MNEPLDHAALGTGSAPLDLPAGTPTSKPAAAAPGPAAAHGPALTAAIDFTYAAAPETTPVTIADHTPMFINGAFVDAADGARLTSINPATGKLLTTVPAASAADVDAAVTAARTAYQDVWRDMPGAERAKYLWRMARMLTERSREFAVLETLDNGKPIRETRDFDIPTAAAHFAHHAGWADKLAYAGYGQAPAPLGVAGQIIPWNFPLLMLAWKVAPALAAGNTVVLKPAETTPLTALAFAQLAADAGLPDGVLNIVTGAGATGALLAGHPGVDKVAFTGSTAVGRSLAASLSGSGKRLTLELGGKGANIVYADAAIDEAVEGIISGIFFNQGHVCCAGSRLLVHEAIAAEVIDRLKARIATLRLGDPLDKNTDIGAINSAGQLARITDLVASGVAEGAGMWQPECSLPTDGYWHAPTVFTAAQPAMRIAREEIFGPVLVVHTFRTPAEAVEKANATPYGLAAGVWTQKGSLAGWTADRLRAGVVWVNTYNRFDPASPFGGMKESGYGREGGRHGLAAYLKEDWA